MFFEFVYGTHNLKTLFSWFIIVNLKRRNLNNCNYVNNDDIIFIEDPGHYLIKYYGQI